MRRCTNKRLPLAALLLAAAWLGGCNNSGGGSGATGPRVSISPGTATVTLNGSVSFTAAVAGVPTVSIASSNGAVRASNVVTITTTASHNLAVGNIVTIQGVTDLSFNGTFTVASVPSATTFTHAQLGTDATSGGGNVSNASVNWLVNDVAGGNAMVGTITTAGLYTAPSALPAALTATITATGASRRSGLATFTTAAAHNFVVGQTVRIAGVTDTSFNGTGVVSSVPTTTTFTVNQGGLADATSGNGTATVFAVTVKAVSVSSTSATATAIVNLDSSIVVNVQPPTATVGTTEQLQLTATVTGAPGNSQAVNWDVNGIAGGNTTVGTVSAAGVYTAPATVPSPATVTVRATSQADFTRSDTTNITVVTAAAPTLTSIFPTRAAQGAALLDLFLTGTNFLSTSNVRLNGAPIASFVVISPTLIRARVPASALATAGTLVVDIAPQSGAPTASFNLTVQPVRPALVGPSPDSAPQAGGAVTVSFNGGYFSPSTTAEFNFNARAATINNSRQMDVTLGGADLATAGLFPVGVRNSAATPSLAVTNLAVSPNAAPAVAATLPAGTQPSAVAINTATGIAVVANRGSNNVTLIDLGTNTVVNTIAVGASPTGVAVDNIRNVALVANNGAGNVSVVDLAGGTVTATITGFPAPPVAVAVNPFTGLALVTMQSTNVAAIVDLATNRIVSGAAHSGGADPQAAVEPRLNWAVATPGGAGTLAIVDLGRRVVASIAGGTSGAVRNSNIVTITTSAAHSFVVGQAVFIENVTDPSFNGLFSITTVPTTTTFTYAQTGAAASSGGGTVTSTPALATVNLGGTLRGVSVNSETSSVFMANPGGSAASVFSLLDQTVLNTAVDAGALGAAVNPLTNTGVVVSPNSDRANVVDLRGGQAAVNVNVGTDPRAVAIDAGLSVAVVANEGSNNVSIINLGAIRSLHITQLSPFVTFTSAAPVNITVIGSGFTATSAVRLDETPVTTNFVNSRTLTATIPAAMLGSARRFALDVENSAATRSNVTDFTVIQPVAVGAAPRGVAIDAERDIAIVANSGGTTASVIDLVTGAVTNTITVGTAPQGVAINSRAGRAVVTNSGSNNASIIDLATNAVLHTVTVGTEPLGVDINPVTGIALVANATSNTLSSFASDSATTPSAITVAVDLRPIAVAFDYTRDQAIVVQGGAGNAALVTYSSGAPTVGGRITGLQLPTGVAYDPVSDLILINVSLSNNVVIVNPATNQSSGVRTGINPTSIAVNGNAATLVTVNTASDSVTVMDFITRRVRAILPLKASQQLAVAIHPFTNMAVICDEANNRVLLVPLPR